MSARRRPAVAKVVAWTNLIVPAVEAKPVPELARPLGRIGVNTADFCKQFNARAEAEGWKKGAVLPVKLFAYNDRTYKFEMMSPLLKEILYNHKLKMDTPEQEGFVERSDTPLGWIDVREIYEIAKLKSKDTGNEGRYPQTLEDLCKRIAVECEKWNIKVVQFGGKKAASKKDRMFEPSYNLWTLYPENDLYWKGDRDTSKPYRWRKSFDKF